MSYKTDETHLHVQLHQSGHRHRTGWLSVGFAIAPNQMTGATAVIATPGASPPMRIYRLGGKSSSSITPLPDDEQVALEDAIFDTTGQSTTLSFKLRRPGTSAGRRLSRSGRQLFEAPVPTDDSLTPLIFAHGDTPSLVYHGFYGKAFRLVGLVTPDTSPPPGWVAPPPSAATRAAPPIARAEASELATGGGAGGIVTFILLLVVLPAVAYFYILHRRKTKADAKDTLNETAAAMAQTTTYPSAVQEVSATAGRGHRATCVGVELSAGHQAPAPPETTRERQRREDRDVVGVDEAPPAATPTWREWLWG